MVAVCSVMTLLTSFFVIARLYLHLHTGHKFGFDDCVMPSILVLTGRNPFADSQADFCYTATVLTFGYTGIMLSRKLHIHTGRTKAPFTELS